MVKTIKMIKVKMIMMVRMVMNVKRKSLPCQAWPQKRPSSLQSSPGPPQARRHAWTPWSGSTLSTWGGHRHLKHYHHQRQNQQHQDHQYHCHHQHHHHYQHHKHQLLPVESVHLELRGSERLLLLLELQGDDAELLGGQVQLSLQLGWGEYCFFLLFSVKSTKKSRIRETPTLSTDADIRTDTNLKRSRDLSQLLFYFL